MSTQPPPAPAPALPSILSPSIPTAFPAPAGCSGDGCLSRDPWPLHSVKHRDAICRLCTGCVLKYHPSQFCSLCLDLISDPTSAASESASIINCSSCNNVSHSSCLPPSSSSTSPDFFLCPACTSNPAQTDSSKGRVIDINYAKSMVCAARISASSMSRAAAQARGEAERKVKEAIVARKRAREMLDSVIVVARREKERKTDKEKFTRFYTNNNSNSNNNGKNNNNEGIGGLERKIAPLNSRVGKVEEQVESKDIKPVAILPRSDGNQIS